MKLWVLVNPVHFKSVPGRKTDVKDFAWLAQLLECGLLRETQRVQKVLERRHQAGLGGHRRVGGVVPADARSAHRRRARPRGARRKSSARGLLPPLDREGGTTDACPLQFLSDGTLPGVLRAVLDHDAIEFIHVRNVHSGCFSFTAQRAS